MSVFIQNYDTIPRHFRNLVSLFNFFFSDVSATKRHLYFCLQKVIAICDKGVNYTLSFVCVYQWAILSVVLGFTCQVYPLQIQ